MQSTPATTVLNQRGVDYRLHSYRPDTHTTSYGARAVEALGLPPQQVFKTLIADVEGRLVAAVVPVSAQLDLRALAAALGAKKAIWRRWPMPNGPPVTSPEVSHRWGTASNCLS